MVTLHIYTQYLVIYLTCSTNTTYTATSYSSSIIYSINSTHSSNVASRINYLQRRYYLQQQVLTAVMLLTAEIIYCRNYLQQQCPLQQSPATTCAYSSKAHCDNALATTLCYYACGKFLIHQYYLQQQIIETIPKLQYSATTSAANFPNTNIAHNSKATIPMAALLCHNTCGKHFYYTNNTKPIAMIPMAAIQ